MAPSTVAEPTVSAPEAIPAQDASWATHLRLYRGLLRAAERGLSCGINPFDEHDCRPGRVLRDLCDHATLLHLEARLVPLAAALEDFFLAEAARFDEGIADSTLKSALDCVRRAKTHFTGFAAPYLAELHYPGVEILEYCVRKSSTPNDEVYGALQRLNEGLTINKDLIEPQEGFGRAYSAEECRNLVFAAGARLFLMLKDDALLGYYILSTSSEGFSADACEGLAKLRAAGRTDAEGGSGMFDYQEQALGWLEIVGITREGRRVIAEAGGNAYDLIHAAAVQTARAEGLEALFAHVREGPQGNTVMPKHEARGWCRTKVVMHMAGHPYRMIWLPLESADPKTVMTPERATQIAERYAGQHLVGAEVHAYDCADAFTLVIRPLAYRLRQLTPKRDVWQADHPTAAAPSRPASLIETLDTVRRAEFAAARGPSRQLGP